MRPGGPAPRWAIGPVAVLGAHILDILGRPVESIPPGQGSARLVAWQGCSEPVALPAIAVDVVDTTGCGDGFNAGMITGLLSSPLVRPESGRCFVTLVGYGRGAPGGRRLGREESRNGDDRLVPA